MCVITTTAINVIIIITTKFPQFFQPFIPSPSRRTRVYIPLPLPLSFLLYTHYLLVLFFRGILKNSFPDHHAGGFRNKNNDDANDVGSNNCHQ